MKALHSHRTQALAEGLEKEASAWSSTSEKYAQDLAEQYFQVKANLLDANRI
jgi:hypothetical protein